MWGHPCGTCDGSKHLFLTHLIMSSNASATCGAHGEQSGTPLSARRNGVFRSTCNASELCGTTNGSQAIKALHEAANTRVDPWCQSQPNASGPCYIGRIGGFGLAGPPLRPTQPTSCFEQSRPHVTFGQKIIRLLRVSQTPPSLRLGMEDQQCHQ